LQSFWLPRDAIRGSYVNTASKRSKSAAEMTATLFRSMIYRGMTGYRDWLRWSLLVYFQYTTRLPSRQSRYPVVVCNEN
jgi:hypothetical protein